MKIRAKNYNLSRIHSGKSVLSQATAW